MTAPTSTTIAARGRGWLARTSTLVAGHLIIGLVVYLRPFGEANSPVGEALYLLGPPAMVVYSGVLIRSLRHAHRLPAIGLEEAVLLFPYAVRRQGIQEDEVKVRRVIEGAGSTIVFFTAAERRPRFLSVTQSQVVDARAFDQLIERLRSQLEDG